MTAWRGVLAPMNTESGDGRVLVLEDGATPLVRPLPLPLHAQRETGEGHDGSVVIGRITRVWLEGPMLMGEGDFDMADPEAAQWVRRITDGFAGGVSVDLDHVHMTVQPRDADGNLVDASPDEDAYYQAMADGDPLYLTDSWRIMGATVVSHPAFAEARIQVVDDEVAQVDTPEHTGGMIALIPTEDDARWYAVDGGDPPEELHVTLAYLGDDVTDWDDSTIAAVADAVSAVAPPTVDGRVFGTAQFNGECAVYLIESAGLTDLAARVREAATAVAPVPPSDYDGFIPHMTAGWNGMTPDQLAEPGTVRFDRLRVAIAGRYTDIPLSPVTDSLVAAGLVYDADNFRDPQLENVTPLTVDDAGRVYGHLAAWGTCHVGCAGKCVTPPTTRSSYKYFHRGRIDTTEGSVDVGLLTMDTGHAQLGIGRGAALAHYDNTGTQIAVIRCGEDQFGIWVSGQLVPGVTDEQVDVLRRSSVSGDWRGIDGNRELVAALVVNVPGFPIPTTEALVASAGQADTLVAAGVVLRDIPEPHDERPRTAQDLDAMVAAATAKAQQLWEQRQLVMASTEQRVNQVRVALAQRRVDKARARIDGRVAAVREDRVRRKMAAAQRRIDLAMAGKD